MVGTPTAEPLITSIIFRLEMELQRGDFIAAKFISLSLFI
jgi:hypothetical protein